MIAVSIEKLWVRFVGLVSLTFIIITLYFVWKTPIETVLSCTTLLLVIFIITTIIFNTTPHLLSIDRTLKEIRDILASKSGQKALNPSSNSETKKGEEPQPTGGGAFVGMTIGGLIGLIGGPVGVVIGGLIGALIGNQLEHESIKAEREKRKKVTRTTIEK